MKRVWNYIKWYVEETVSDFRIVWGVYPNVLIITLLVSLLTCVIL